MENTVSEAEARHEFLAQLDPDPQKAELKYHQLRAKLVFYFQQNGCTDPQNLADDVFVRVLRRLRDGAEAYAGVNAYCYGVADYVLREERRRPRAQELPDDLPPSHAESHNALKRPEQSILVQEALQLLPSQDRDLFTRYHLEDREALAAETRLSANALRVQVCRIRQRLLERLAAAGARK